jgi:hypothetical protein
VAGRGQRARVVANDTIVEVVGQLLGLPASGDVELGHRVYTHGQAGRIASSSARPSPPVPDPGAHEALQGPPMRGDPARGATSPSRLTPTGGGATARAEVDALWNADAYAEAVELEEIERRAL